MNPQPASSGDDIGDIGEDALAPLARVGAERDRAIAEAIGDGSTLAEIAVVLGVSTQAAHWRYRWLHLDPTSGVTWHEPPLAA